MHLPEEAVTVATLARFLSKHEPKEGRALVVGSHIYDTSPDRRAYYPNALGLDMIAGPGVDICHNLEKPLAKRWGKFDHIDLCSVLEHVRRPWLLAENVERLMKPDATLLVSVPFVWRIHSYPSDFWRMTPEALDVLFPRIEWTAKRFVIGEHLRKRVPAINLRDKYLARSEVVAFGCLTS